MKVKKTTALCYRCHGFGYAKSSGERAPHVCVYCHGRGWVEIRLQPAS